MRAPFVMLLMVGTLGGWVAFARAGVAAPTTRPAAVAGSWYPGEPKALREMLAKFLEAAPAADLPGEPVALVAPHAGYAYSGAIAAAAFKVVAGRNFTRVVVLGPSHHVMFSGAAVPTVTHFATPLGNIPLDRQACDRLAKAEGFIADDRAHAREHSLEMQLPLLQTTLKDFRLVPIVVGSVSDKDVPAIAAAVRGLLDERTLLVASTDFTHYGQGFGYVPFRTAVAENLARLDDGAIQRVLADDWRGLRDYVRTTGATICGEAPVAIVLAALADREDVEGVRLAYATSGQMTGDWSSSVSYAGIVLCQGASGSLNDDEQRLLLQLARRQVRTFLRDGKPLSAEALKDLRLTARVKKPGAAFVTLTRRGQLRGCIGHVAPVVPLYESVLENAVAACRDPRFTRSPVTAAEEPALEIEISVLSRYRLVGSVDEIKIGRDGVILRVGGAGALFLPQVPGQQGWNLQQYLSNLALKAGLNADAWKAPEARISRFTAQVFGEAHPASAPATQPGRAGPPAGGETH